MTQPDRPAGRGRHLTAPPVKRRALEAGVPVLQPARLRDPEWPARLGALGAEVAVVVAFGQILPRAVLDAPARGSINVHASLLPRYRGAAPIAWAIIRGEAETGITTFQMDEGMDTGPMLIQEATPIGDDETAGELAERLSRLGARVLTRTLDALEALTPRPQDPSLATMAPRLKKEDGALALGGAARDLANRVRGLQSVAGRGDRDPGRPAPGLARPRAAGARRGGAGRAGDGGRRDRHRDRRWDPAAARGAAGKPAAHGLGRLPPRRAPPARRPRHRGATLSQPARVAPVSRSRWEALEVLVRVERDRAFADLALMAALDRASLDPRDAALASELVYGTLRWRRYLDWRLSPHSARPLPALDPWVRALLRLTAYQVLLLDRVPAFAAVDEAVSLARHKGRHRGPADYVNAVLRSLTRSPALPPLPADPVEALGTRLSFPDWVAGRWVGRFGTAEAEALMAALNERPPTTVRVNALRASQESLVRRLRDQDLADARPTALAPEGVRVARGAVARSAAFADGWCTIQDEASMLVARLLDPRPGEVIADVCAAPGTKATHIAELMQDRGRVIAMDPHGARLKLAGEAARRLHLRAIELHPGAVAALAPRWRERCAGVLVDAPCSNLGVLRRNPEVKWRRTEADVARLAETQRQIVAAAASMVAAGGRLVYATCSLEPEENEAVVGTFLAANPDWAPATPSDFPVPPDRSGFVRCLPHVHGTDGFTAILLTRRTTL